MTSISEFFAGIMKIKNQCELDEVLVFDPDIGCLKAIESLCVNGDSLQINLETLKEPDKRIDSKPSMGINDCIHQLITAIDESEGWTIEEQGRFMVQIREGLVAYLRLKEYDLSTKN